MSPQRICIAGLGFLAVLGVLIAAGPREAEWTVVNDAINRGLPKTAIENLEPIIAAAIAENKHAEAIKAISMKISLEGNIQGNKPEEKITRMRAEIAKAPAEMKPVMEAIMANWFWHYFQQNRWRFMQRSQTAAPPGDDFTTWDLSRILSEIDKQFQAALADALVLKAVPIGEYDDLLEKGNSPDSYRPTLFDVLAHNALEFYSSGEQVASRAQDAFDFSADSPIFASADQFMSWRPDSTDKASLQLKAIRLYQDLLKFHRNDEDRSAYLDADLLRLNYGNNTAFGEEKTPRYKAALRRFANRHASHVISVRALHHLATAFHVDGDLVTAHQIASEGLKRGPESVGGRRCYNLIQQIESRSSRTTTERVWNDPRPTIDVHYRNVTRIFFRLVPFDFVQYARSNRWQPEQLNQDLRRDLLARRAVKSWSAELPKTDDFQERLHSVPSPEDLPSGSYFLIASHNPAFNDQDNQVSFAEVWESKLAIVTRNHQGRALVDGFVLDAKTGNPISGATIDVWHRGNENRFTKMPSTQTNRNGLFRVRGTNHQQLLVLATHKDQKLSSASYLQSFRRQPTRKSFQTLFFTDRSLYRPGQTIHYKGICVSVDPQDDDYKTLPQRSVTLIFSDVNGKEIERLDHRTNDYGSFSGSVTAPRDRLMGQMTLKVAAGPRGSTGVTVEEYKRPKFQVEMAAPTGSAKLGEVVSLKGTATAYTGAAINDAKVSWRVVREVQYPIWWFWRCWWMPPHGGSSQEIAHGTLSTAADGTFEVQFTAKPDASVSEESEPTFRYTVYADVTDTTGETRSAQKTVNVGYTSLAASMSADDWLTEDAAVEVKVRTTTLDGEGQKAIGIVRIHRVVQPETITRLALSGRRYPRNPGDDPKPDPTNPNSWPLGEAVFESEFETNAAGHFDLSTELTAGMYRAKLETTDPFGKAVTAELPLQVLDPTAKKLNLKIPNLYASPKKSQQPGEEYKAIWGSGYESARAFVEIEHRGRLLQSYWTNARSTQSSITQRVSESMRGGFFVRTTMVRENRAYMRAERVDVPWSNKKLTVKWEHFVSKLKPAAKETWTAVVSGPDAEHAVAEMVAAMYDASLDAYKPHHWSGGFGVFRTEHSNVQAMFENQLKNLQNIYHSWGVQNRNGGLTYRQFPSRIIQNFSGFQFGRNRYSRGQYAAPMMEMGMGGAMMDAMAAPAASGMVTKAQRSEETLSAAVSATADKDDATVGPDLSNVSARKNLNETAFFFPHLLSGKDGTVKMEFTMPEALTEWKFFGFAHDNDLRSGLLTDTTVTAKDLMVQPNPPRFVREGDVVEFTVKVSNQSPTRQTGKVRLTFSDAGTNDPVDAKLKNVDRDRPFDIPAGESATLAWRLQVPDDLGFLTYKAVGSTGRLSDGEEGFLPVLSRRILVTESLPLPIRGKQQKQFAFKKLLESDRSDSLKHQSLTVQMVSNPSWYAVMALPYLMEYPHECAEQTFNRLYANSLARHIAASDPKIHRVFEQWRATPALDSPLTKNQDLKAVMLEETPWFQQAQSESQARRNVGILFEDNRLDAETARMMHKLTQMQLPDGAWPWFPGGRANDYITLYITTGFGRIRHLGVDIDTTAAINSLNRLDRWVTERYEKIKAADRGMNHLSTSIAFYLYGRSFFLKDLTVAPEHSEAVNYWLSQARTYWLDLAHRQSQAHMAVALKRFGDPVSAKRIMESLKQRSVSDEEMGMHWRELEMSWWWYRAPIETQAMMIEAFDEVMNDKVAVEDCKVWLLKQKQTQDWKTTKATADAVYALLLRGTNVLSSDALVEVTLGNERIRPDNVEAGTGFYEQRFGPVEVESNLGQVSIKKVDEGVAWGSLHWQYLEDMAKITPYEGTPLRLTKELYVKRNSPEGPKLELVQGPIEVGDELVVRVVLRTDRDMEYVHLKDYRGSGTEPVNVLSQYKYQDGLAYYESTRDTASHFFIDYLPKGTYVFEYSTRVQLRGEYQTGIAGIQCMYAPEFNSHSESLPIVVK